MNSLPNLCTGHEFHKDPPKYSLVKPTTPRCHLNSSPLLFGKRRPPSLFSLFKSCPGVRIIIFVSLIKITIRFFLLPFSTPRNLRSFRLPVDLLFTESQTQEGLDNITQSIIIRRTDPDPLGFSPTRCHLVHMQFSARA